MPKQKFLDGFIAATGYHRKYAIAVLNSPFEEKRESESAKERRREYNDSVRQVLIAVWTAANHICSKRLEPFLPERIERWNDLVTYQFPRKLKPGSCA
ncbi:MAG TPA: hypothetical protein V6C97_36385 [Oculatellaceae cyanobacterium]